ncbi:MAG: ribonuclease E activity regulator RraA [Granulosicoccus sp.]|nr:ribonuclease E activity regulator RraA [Granulosicoccus sp.]
MNDSVADLCDAYSDQITLAEPLFRDFGGAESFSGPITTLTVDGDFLLIKETLSTAGDNGVLVIDGAGSTEFALLGDRLAAMARESQWSGLIINGCIRDISVVRTISIGVKALGVCPKRPSMIGGGELNKAVSFAGITFKPGEWVYADLDGIIVSAEKLQTLS